MSRPKSVLAALAVLALIPACSMEPRYKSADLVFDAGLVGTWEFQPKVEDGEKPKPAIRVEITGRQLEVADGRLNPDRTIEPAASANAYKVVLTDPETGKSEQLGAFLLDAGGHRLLGMQHVAGTLGPGLFGRPLHLIRRIKREGDRVESAEPNYEIAWIPGAQPLDAPEPERSKPVPTIDDLERRKGGGTFLVFDIDRFVEVHRALASDPRFWKEEQTTIGTRVPE